MSENKKNSINEVNDYEKIDTENQSGLDSYINVDSRNETLNIDDSNLNTETEVNLLHEEKSINNNNNNNTSFSSINLQPEINWKTEAIKGNFMPAVVLLEKKQIHVDDIVEPSTENRLIHLAVGYSYLNVTRCLVENFNCTINIKNIHGHTPLHVICNNLTKDAYLFSYFIKNDFLEINPVDKTGVTPLFYAIMSKFNIALMALAHLKTEFLHVDNFGNNVIYHAITSDNKFALKFFLRNIPDVDLNAMYYKKQVSLAEVLINTKNKSCAKHILKYYSNEINNKSLIACRKQTKDFNFYNKFNYDLLNTLYYYKTGEFLRFLIAMLRKDVDQIQEKHAYTYKWYNFQFMLYHLIVQNSSKCIKYLFHLIWLSILTCYFEFLYVYYIKLTPEKSFLSFSFILSVFEIFSLISVIVSVIIFYFISRRQEIIKNYTIDDPTILIDRNAHNKIKNYDISNVYDNIYSLKNPHHSQDNVCFQLYNAMDRNPLDVFFEEEICEYCIIKKEKSTNHCNICQRCVKDFYFHSRFFNVCFSKANIKYYIIFLISLSITFWSVINYHYYYTDLSYQMSFNDDNKYLNDLKNYNQMVQNAEDEEDIKLMTIYDSKMFMTNIFTFLIYSDIKILLVSIILFIVLTLMLQRAVTLLICKGYKTSYYNMFRYHKKAVGVLQKRKNGYCAVPLMNTISLKQFLKNIIFG